MSDEKIKRGRGRPPLSPEEKEQRRIERNKKINEYHKATGYAAQKKYDEKHPENIAKTRKKYNEKCRLSHDELRFYLPKKSRAEFEKIRTELGLTISDFVLAALESHYKIILAKED